MNTHTDKTQENKGQSIVNTVAQKQNNNESTLQVVDDRPEAVTQRKLQETANNSPQAKQTAQLQAMADGYSAQQEFAIQKKANSTGLPDDLKSGIENLSGYSMDDVKVHYNSDKPGQLQAHAYAQGTDIHVASGQEKHLPHEAWHVVQQKQGRVQPTFQMKGKVNINDDAGLEKEADSMGMKALNQTQTSEINKPLASIEPSNNISQLITVHDDKVWSSYLDKVIINDKQAVITVGSADTMTGGHSTIILECQGLDGLCRSYRIDLWVDESANWHMPITIKERQKESAPWTGLLGGLASMVGNNERSVENGSDPLKNREGEIIGGIEILPKTASHIIKGSLANAVLDRATNLQGSINTDYFYSKTGYFLPIIHFGETRKPINCAGFASLLLETAGIGKSSVVPSSLSGQQSTKEETKERFTI